MVENLIDQENRWYGKFRFFALVSNVLSFYETKQAVQLLIATSVSDPSWISECLYMPLSGNVLSFKARNTVEDGRKLNKWY
eukprot:scaffold52703_cov29-Attheya_sp.AAC.1